MAEKSAQNLIDEIKRAEQQPRAADLRARHPLCRRTYGQLLADHSRRSPNSRPTVEELMEVPEVAPKSRKASLIFSPSRKSKTDQAPQDEGLKNDREAPGAGGCALRGENVRFTGALARRSRDEAGAEVLRHGGKCRGR